MAQRDDTAPKALGGGGNDVFQALNGYDVTLKGQAGNDAYNVVKTTKVVISDANGASAVVMEKVSKANVLTGADDDIFRLDQVAGSVFKTGLGFDEIISTNSGGGNKLVFGEDGRAVIKYSGMEFIDSAKADVIDVGGGQVELLVQVSPWNLSGRAEIVVNKFNANEDNVVFNWGYTPDLVTVDGDNATATWFNDAGVFQLSIDGIGGSVPNGIFSGNTMPGIGAGFGQTQHGFFTLPNNGGPEGGFGLVG